MIYVLDADQHGTDSIEDLVSAGKVTVLPCPTYADFDRHVATLYGTVGPTDTVVLDTVTQLLDTIRSNARLGSDPTADIYARAQAKYLGGDKQFLNVYNMAQDLVKLRFKNLAARGACVINICQEAERPEDISGLKKVQPDVNPAFIGDLIGASSDVFRLKALQEDVTDKAGNTAVKAGTRVLYLRGTDEFVAKYQVAREHSEKIPKYLLDPTMPKLMEILNKKPKVLTLYGPPGAGKTTLAVSEAYTTKTKGNK